MTLSKILATVGIVLALALGTGGLVTVHGLDSRVSSLQSQLQLDKSQLRQDKAELATVSQQSDGAHRDLITCADLQNLGLQDAYGVTLTQDNSGNIYATLNQSPISLPGHCINH